MFYLFYLGSVPIKSYWPVMGLALIIGFILFYLEARAQGLNKKQACSFYLWALASVSIGMRLFYLLLTQPRIIFQEPGRIFSFSEIYWQGGISLYGGILGGLIFSLWFSRRRKIYFWKLADLFTPSLIIVSTLVRLGCFLNGCCYGKPTTLPWGMVFTNPLVLAPKAIPLHPVQIYEAGVNLILFFYFWSKRRKTRFSGELILKYAFAYNLLRLIVEFYKHPIYHYKNTPFTFSQILALFFLILTLILFRLIRHKKFGQEKFAAIR
jgi:phosphatidylglycerol:prolipoprotein diacylglycerol transferase